MSESEVNITGAGKDAPAKSGEFWTDVRASEIGKGPTEAEQIVNAPVRVAAFGRTYDIQKFTLGPLIRALPHIAPLGYLLRSATKADITELLVTSLSVGGEPALGLISVATSEPLEWLETKDPLDGLDVLVAVIEKNADYFFEPANLARLKASFAKLESIVQKHGGSISTTSSSMDTTT